MHGFIFNEFEKFAIQHLTYSTWNTLLQELQLKGREYSPQQLYPDQELFKLITAVADLAQSTVPELLEKFGSFIVPDLLKVYRAYIEPEWRTLDLLEHAESTIHIAVRKSTAGAAPPILQIERMRPHEIIIQYVSHRDIPEFGVGLIKGIAAHYNEGNNIYIELQKHNIGSNSTIIVRSIK